MCYGHFEWPTNFRCQDLFTALPLPSCSTWLEHGLLCKVKLPNSLSFHFLSKFQLQNHFS